MTRSAPAWFASLSMLLLACGGTTPPAHQPGDPVEPLPADTAAGNTPAPSSPEIKKGEASLEAGDFKAARETFEAVLKKEPSNARALYYLAVSLEKLGDKQGAEKSYREAMAKAPELADSALNLSAMLIEAGRNDDAVKVLRTALAKSPQDPGLHANLGHALLAADDKEGAIKEYQQALRAVDDPQVRLALASLLAATGKKDQAAAELKKIAAKADKRELLATVGDAFGRVGAFADCAAAFDKAIQLQAAPELHVQRGLCRHELKDDAGAKADYDAAIKLDANYAPAWYYLGMHLSNAGKKAEAIKAFEKCKQLKPDSSYGKKSADRIAELKKPGK